MTSKHISKSLPKQSGSNPLEVPLVHTLYDLFQTWNRLLAQFPKSQRYVLGQTCSNYLLTLLEHVLAAAADPDQAIKQRALARASVKLDTLKLLIRLAKDCGCVSNDAYLAIESELHTSGKMIGGWRKSLSS